MGGIAKKSRRNWCLNLNQRSQSSSTPNDGKWEEGRDDRKYNELKAIRSKKNEVIPRSEDEDNQLITKAYAICLDALNAIQAALGS